MDDVRFLLKFGKKEHIKEFVNGSLFFSNAEIFWKIEQDKKIKGQGDILEAGTRIFSQSTIAQEHGSEIITVFNTKSNMLVRFEPAKNIPVFCLFAVFDSDCSKDDKDNYSVCLPEKTKQVICEHFPRADAVAIIDCPQQFIKDIENSIGCRTECGQVQYFNIDEGFDVGEGRVAIDMEYVKYLVQDVPPIKENGNLKYVFCADYVYRSLFCKDVYFRQEQEYRIVLPEELISKGKHYPVKFSTDIQMMSMDEFMK